jgi:low temperature requirement protein LtrA
MISYRGEAQQSSGQKLVTHNHRLTVLFVMACLVGLTTNMLQAFHETYSQLVAFYLAARLLVAFYYLGLAYLIPMVKGMMITQAIAIYVPSALWIASIYVDMPNRLPLIWVALFLDLFAAVFAIFLIRGSHVISTALAAWVARVYEFYPAVNIEHKTERTNAFVTLIFGYSVVAVLYQNTASFGVNAFFGKAVLGLIQESDQVKRIYVFLSNNCPIGFRIQYSLLRM